MLKAENQLLSQSRRRTGNKPTKTTVMSVVRRNTISPQASSLPIKNVAPGGYRLSQRYDGVDGDDECHQDENNHHNFDDRIDRLDDDIETLQASYQSQALLAS